MLRKAVVVVAAALLLAAVGAGAVAQPLTPNGCIADVDDFAGCGATAQGLNGAEGVAVSPDGASVYAVSDLDDAIVRFDRAANGALSNPSCIADVVPVGCGATAQGLNGAHGVAVSPDGASVYAVSDLDDAIVRFDRAANGSLSSPSCIADVGDVAGCGATAQGLQSAHGVTVSPDGASVYAVSAVDDAIVRFDRAANGALTPQGCIAEVGDAAGCGATAQGLDGAQGVAVSPDGASVYAASGGAIVRFDRAANGALTPQGCIADVGDLAGCGATAQGLHGAEGVAVSPDGTSVYAVSANDSAIVRFDRAANGPLSSPSCIADVGDLAGCGPTAQGLNGAQDVAVSPDSASVYAVSFTDSAIVRLSGELAPVCRTSSSNGAPGAVQTVPLDCFDPNGDPLTIAVVKGPAHGTLGAVNQAAKTVSYIPEGGFSGVDSFDIQATADGKTSNVSTVVIGVQSATGPPGPTGPAGPQGPAGAQGPPGRDARVTCKLKKAKKVKCVVTFAAAAGVRMARLSRRGVTYAEGKPASSGGELVLLFSPAHKLKRGRYTLTVVQHLDGQRVVTKSSVRVR
jgi:DNA-binding beta-propeller fold protein YncE